MGKSKIHTAFDSLQKSRRENLPKQFFQQSGTFGLFQASNNDI